MSDTHGEQLKVGIFIPTMDRIPFVIRQLRYYASVKCPHTIYISDSSKKEDSDKIKDEVYELGDKIKAVYNFIPGYDVWEAHYHAISMVKEKYICYSGDDDYQIPNSLTKCARFLEENSDYSTCSGRAVSFRLLDNGVYGTLNRLADYPRQQIEDGTASARIIKFFSNYFVTHFSVNRTGELQKYWASSGITTDKSFRSEILPTSLPLIAGKSKTLDCLGFVRQIHNRHHELPDTYDWITEKDWQLSYEIFSNILAKEIAIKDNLNINEAHKIVKQAFSGYLINQLTREYSSRYNQPSATHADTSIYLRKLRLKMGHKLPWLKYIYRHTVRSLARAPLQLHHEVLQKESKYYDDFKPIMDSFTNKLGIDKS